MHKHSVELAWIEGNKETGYSVKRFVFEKVGASMSLQTNDGEVIFVVSDMPGSKPRLSDTVIMQGIRERVMKSNVQVLSIENDHIH